MITQSMQILTELQIENETLQRRIELFKLAKDEHFRYEIRRRLNRDEFEDFYERVNKLSIWLKFEVEIEVDGIIAEAEESQM